MALDTPPTETEIQPIVIRHSKWKLLLMCLLSLVFVLGGLWMMSSNQGSKVSYEGLAVLLFFSLCLLIFLFQMLAPSLLLLIDDEGICSFYPLWRPLTIRWEEISSIYPIKMRFSVFLTITVSSSAKSLYIARNFQSGKIPLPLRKGNGPAIAISLPLSFPQAITLLQKRYAVQIEQYRISVQEK